MDENSLVRALNELPLGSLRYFASLASTNDEAARWAEQGAPHLALVVADEQTQGRGRSGRRWYSPPGAGLAFSLVMRLPQPTDPAWLFARLVALGGLAISDALLGEYRLPAQIKWPNDVLIRRRKTAGVLAEANWQGDHLQAVILGIGVNVLLRSVPPARELLFPATSVEAELGQPVDRLELLRTILSCLVERLARLEADEFFRDWEERLALRGEWVQILDGEAILDGRLLGLNHNGALRLERADGGILEILSGDVRLRPK